ncbi:MAG: hypothetical protein J5760_07225 [Clostridia bacterium]|nr:hypothetical protein [Clostridia bacterium]
MKKIMCIAFSAVILFTALVSCSGSGSSTESVSEPSDPAAATPAESLADGTAEIQWPAHLLPEGLPVPLYDSIYSVKCEENKVEIVMFGDYDLQSAAGQIAGKTREEQIQIMESLVNPREKYCEQLESLGYVRYLLTTSDVNDRIYVARNGFKVFIEETAPNQPTDMDDLLDESPHHYVFRITVSPAEICDSFFYTYPSEYTDIGYEEIPETDHIPEEYLPESLFSVNDDPRALKKYVSCTGAFAIFNYAPDGQQALNELLERGGFVWVDNVWCDKDGNYVFIKVNMIDGEYRYFFQMCKHNDKVTE